MPAKAKAPSGPRNYEIAPGVSRFSRAAMYHKRGLYKKLEKPFPKKQKKVEKEQTYAVKKVDGDKNGGERKIPLKKSV
jgi:large subunit ribosomal protein L6e